MRIGLIILTVVFLGFSTNSSLAVEWNWEEDTSFLNPNLDPELTVFDDWLSATCMVDLSGDGTPEYIIIPGDPGAGDILLAEQTGDFPNIIWELRADFFEDVEIDLDVCAIVPYDFNEDGDLELILVPWYGVDEYPILENTGDYDHPRWRRADYLFPDVDYESGTNTPQFCDFDDDGLLDLLFGYDNGYFRYEQDEDGEWHAMDFTEVGYEGWTISFYLADMDNDGDLDILGSYDMPCEWLNSAVIINNGTPNDPDWSEANSLEYYCFYNPVPCDLNDDGYTDIVDGWSYMLHTGEDEAAWERPVYWSLHLSSGRILIHDFNQDGSQDLVASYTYGSYNETDWRLAQYTLSEAGWQDALFFGGDYADWWLFHSDTRQLAAVDIFGTGRPCLIACFYSNEQGPRREWNLFEDVDEGDNFDWREVEGFFAELIDEDLYNQVPSFGDLNDDGNPDLAITKQQQHNSASELEFYRFTIDNRDPTWELMEDWNEGIDDTTLMSVEFGDLDRDGDQDMVGIRKTGGWNFQAYLYENIGNPQNPEWQCIPDVIPEGFPGNTNWLQITDVDDDDKPDLLTESKCYLNRTTYKVETRSELPMEFEFSAFPNPFNNSVSLSFYLPELSNVTLEVYNLSGRLIWQLDEQSMGSGRYVRNVEAKDWSTGIYLARLITGQKISVKKITLLK